jgi:hypothetical protein
VDATVIAVASVLVSGATGISVPLITARAERKKSEQGFRHERLIRDFDELRSLLDEVAEQVPHYFNAVATLESMHPAGTASSGYSGELSSYREIGERIRRLRARLIIRSAAPILWSAPSGPPSIRSGRRATRSSG